MFVYRLVTLALLAVSTSSLVGGCAPEASQPLPYGDMAARIVQALAPGNERIILRYDPATHPVLATVVRDAAERAGATVELLPYGDVERFDEHLAAADVYVWLPAGPTAVTTASQTAALGRWLDEGLGRQVHFHWNGGTQGLDGIVGTHSSIYDSIYLEALDLDYPALDRAQTEAIARLRSGEIRVTTPAGTDLRFSVGDRPFNQQNGDASAAAMTDARTRIDREIELPAGVVRVAPLEQTVHGTMVVPMARFGEQVVRELRLEFEGGELTTFSAIEGEEVFREVLRAEPALRFFRELAIGFNPKLVKPAGEPWLPYYGYGAGAVRLSLGNNLEVGGIVDGTGVRWFFFLDATVAVDETVLVTAGTLETP